MLMPTSVREDISGYTPRYDEDYICEMCGEKIECGGEYIEKYNGDVMCADCIEKSSNDDILDFLGYDNIFDLLGKTEDLHYA